jgi:Fe-S-cluster containining protein
VWVTPEEIQEIANYLNMPLEQFVERYVRQVNGEYSLKEDPESYDCLFLENKKQCRIYPVRPKQCRTYPWWVANLKSQEAWDAASGHCEGINHPDAPLITLQQIQKELL